MQEATAVRDAHLQAMLSGPSAARPALAPDDSVRLDQLTALPRGSQDAKATAMMHVDDYYRASDYAGMTRYLNALHTKDPAAFEAAVQYVAAIHVQEPTRSGYRNNYRNDVHTERLFQWIDANGSDALKAQFAAEVFAKVDPQQSDKYAPHMKHVFSWLEQPQIAGRLLDGKPEVLQGLLMATPHWEATRPGHMKRIVDASARYYGEQIGEAIKTNDHAAVRRYSVKFGQLIGGTERSLRAFYGSRADAMMDAVTGWMFKGLTAVAMTPLSPSQKTAYSMVSPLVGKYFDSPEPLGPKKASEARSEALRLLDELYWNTVDPNMELRTVEGADVVPLTSMSEYQRLRSELSVIHTDIADGLGHAQGDDAQWL